MAAGQNFENLQGIVESDDRLPAEWIRDIKKERRQLYIAKRTTSSDLFCMNRKRNISLFHPCMRKMLFCHVEYNWRWMDRLRLCHKSNDMKMFINYSLSNKNIIWHSIGFSHGLRQTLRVFFFFKYLRAIKQLRKIKYLGVALADDRKCDTGIRILIVKEKDAFQKLKRVLKNRKILFETK